jgi:hypothetical protein
LLLQASSNKSPAINFRQSRFSHSAILFSDFKVILTTPSIQFSKPELAVSHVFHNDSFTQLIFLGSVVAEEAWSSITSYVPLGSLIYELACKSNPRV